MGANGRTMVKVRVIAPPDVIESVADALELALEGMQFEVIDESSPQPMNPPDEDKERLYMVAIK